MAEGGAPQVGDLDLLELIIIITISSNNSYTLPVRRLGVDSMGRIYEIWWLNLWASCKQT
jgi:hypothetical protein